MSIWLYVIAGIVILLVVTYAANQAHNRRVGRQELRERRVEFNEEHGGPLQRVFRRLRRRRD